MSSHSSVQAGHDLVVKHPRRQGDVFRWSVAITSAIMFLVLFACYGSSSSSSSSNDTARSFLLAKQLQTKGTKRAGEASGSSFLALPAGEPASIDIILGRNDRMMQDQELLASLEAQSQQVRSELADARKESLALVKQQVDDKRSMLQLLARQKSLVQDMGEVSRAGSFAGDERKAVSGHGASSAQQQQAAGDQVIHRGPP
mmetsp:Transcript_51773/g.161099  ORF Transcript_51773/g.161099 Transcript_51773/m.161099 type:complete len:201 (-) Transcript_51773:94-696(-)